MNRRRCEQQSGREQNSHGRIIVAPGHLGTNPLGTPGTLLVMINI